MHMTAYEQDMRQMLLHLALRHFDVCHMLHGQHHGLLLQCHIGSSRSSMYCFLPTWGWTGYTTGCVPLMHKAIIIDTLLRERPDSVWCLRSLLYQVVWWVMKNNEYGIHIQPHRNKYVLYCPLRSDCWHGWLFHMHNSLRQWHIPCLSHALRLLSMLR